jgi:hypothetical protein
LVAVTNPFASGSNAGSSSNLSAISLATGRAAARRRLRLRQRRPLRALHRPRDRVACSPLINGIDGLAAAMLIAAVAITPLDL